MKINGVDYHVETQGNGAPLLLLHGFSGSGTNWSAQIAAFTPYFNVITVDLPGHGRTDPPPDTAPYAVEPAAADLIAMLDALSLPTIHLLGYSMGGRLALYTALTYPSRIKRLVLESASPGLKTAAERAARREADEQLARRIESESIEAFADYWTNLPLFANQSPELRQRLHRQRLDNKAHGLASSLRGMGTGAQPSLWDALPSLEIETLLLCGALDSKFAAINAEMHTLMPRSTLVTVADAGHTIHAEQPASFQSEVVRFLNPD